MFCYVIHLSSTNIPPVVVVVVVVVEEEVVVHEHVCWIAVNLSLQDNTIQKEDIPEGNE